MTAVLELEDVRVRYGAIEALKGVSLTVEEGEIVALLGANGAGKTTTLRTISGLLRPVTGDVRLRGQSIVGVPAHEVVRLGVSHSPEGRRVFASMTVLENLQMGAYLRKGDTSGDVERIYGLFPILRERRKQPAGTLSGGEQQMLAIGRALMSQPQVLLLDEPSLGLAPLVVQTIFDIIRQINQQGTTVLLVEQNAVQALRLANRGYVVETGELVMTAPAGELLADPRVRAAYLGEDVA